MFTMGVISTSRLENEQRLPIHPDHFELIPDSLRERIVFEEGYGEPFGIADAVLAEDFGGVAARRAIMSDCDVVLLAKPKPEDLMEMREGGILWGWPHCVQQQAITQIAIDRRQTLLAWEAMFTWNGKEQDMHLFCRNNEMAGYCSVAHALALMGLNGAYGPALQAIVLSFGSVSRGAIHALQGMGISDVRVYTQRRPSTLANPIPGPRYGRMRRPTDGGPILVTEEGGRVRPLRDVLGEADVIVNGILQNTDAPLMFLEEDEKRCLKHQALIVDVSCDRGMGFPFARPTSFDEPIFTVESTTYYAVDHSPSWLWRSASWEISRAVLAFVETVMGGPHAWEADETIRRCIEIRDGVIQNEKILRFQHREAAYPHAITS